MDMNDYFYFVHVVEKQGFAPAGRALGIPKSRLSRQINQLEEVLGVRLIQRTSRQFKITDVGRKLYRHARKAVDEVEAANALVQQDSKILSGKIRLSCSVGMAQFALCDIVTKFVMQHPLVEIIQQVTNRAVDIIEEGVDLAIRAHGDTLPDSTLIHRRLASVNWGLFASPDYLENAGTPTSPEQLENHAGLKLGWRPDEGSWLLRHYDGSNFSIPYQPRICSDDMFTLKKAASVGLGIIGLPIYVCREEQRINQLVRILPDWTAGNAEISLLMPSRQGVSPVVRAFVDYLSVELPNMVMV